MSQDAAVGSVPAAAPLSFATRRGLWILALAGALGVAADALLNTYPWGLNLALWTTGVAGVIWWYVPRLGHPLDRGARWLVVPAVVLAAMFAWRDSATLGLLNGALILVCLGLLPVSTASGRLWHAGVEDFINTLAHGAGRGFAALALPALVHIRWPEVSQRITWVWVGPVARGTGLAIPVVLFFASFLLSADPIFQRTMADLFRWDWWEIARHLAVMLAGTWVGGGMVWHALSAVPRPAMLGSGTGNRRVGTIETAIVLNALSIMLLAFVAVQVRYLFGGAEVVEASTTLTYAEYARRGFFELVTVGAAALVVLLLGDAATLRTTRRQDWVFRASAALLVALALAVLASAVQRMLIYQQQYGLTELRVYTVAFMGWMCVVYLWFSVTVLTGRGHWFIAGALVAALALAGVLNTMNTDRFITAANLGRTDFDATYHAALSADTVPLLVEALPALPLQARGHVAHCLLARWGGGPAGDWRTWNAARDEAVRLVAERREQLSDWALNTRCGARLQKTPN